ncbi:MAG: FHA domain-containing protein, partial [Burkholderiales bacterium]|nr:FHA domain-containing protein [Burkholderiales bacterium]
MDEVIHVEILGRLGDVAHRITLHHLPVRIGRAYDNDVIVDDPYVAPHHLRVERDADGALHAVDLGSRNGLHLLDPVRRVANTPVGGGERLRIGHTPLRIRARDFAVPAELPDPNADRR